MEKTIEIKFNNGNMIIKAENKSFQLNDIKYFQAFGTYTPSKKSKLLEFYYDSREKQEKDRNTLELISKLTNSEGEYSNPSQWEEEVKKEGLEWVYLLTVNEDYKLILE